MPGGRLTQEDRRRIAAWLAEGLSHAEIGRRLSRPTSTITREVSRNRGPATRLIGPSGPPGSAPAAVTRPRCLRWLPPILARTDAIRSRWPSSRNDSPRRSCRWGCRE